MDTQKNTLEVHEKSRSNGRVMFFHPVTAILLAVFFDANKQIHVYPFPAIEKRGPTVKSGRVNY
jgi:hypothetical protein